MLLELLLYQAFLQGSRIVDIDPKGDHLLDELPGVGDNTEVIELSGGEARIAACSTRCGSHRSAAARISRQAS